MFVGPCVAKKAEARDEAVPQVIDEVLTLQEARRLLADRRVDVARAAAAPWDEPAAGRARAFPLPGGLLQSADLDHGILDPDVLVVARARRDLEVLAGLGERETGGTGTLLVEALMCRGCYCGPGISSEEPGLLRKRRVAQYMTDQAAAESACAAAPAPDLAALTELAAALPLGRGFRRDDQRSVAPTEEQIREILARTNKFFAEDELNCGACGYPTCRDKAVAVHSGMAEEAMCLPFMIDQAERVCHEIGVPWRDMRDVHRHLINTEKLASMGQMAAGVAHELNNPLSTILLYTHILGKKAGGPRRPGPRPAPGRRRVGALQEDRRQSAGLRAPEPRSPGGRGRREARAAGCGRRRLHPGAGRGPPGAAGGRRGAGPARRAGSRPARRRCW